MKFTILSSSLAVAMVHAYPPSYMASLSKGAEPGENAIFALGEGIGFDRGLAALMWEQAIHINPTPNATFFTLDQLNVHNILEHDGSLTRTDDFLGSNHIFNQTVFDETRSYWTGDVINATMLANSKIARQVTSRATNPTYTFTATMEQFSIGEVAAPIIGLGDMEAATVSRAFVEYWIQNERLPSELGWVKKKVPVTLQNILAVNEIITNATSLITTREPVPGPPRPVDAYRPNLHAGTF
ncbi:hypothetical protein VdG1_03458 [Verticillium dahliae VDG1]|nr:hypothetical protein VdG1_03458 [Verticillium dahliae VDG1]